MAKTKTTHTPGPWTQGKYETGTIERRSPDGLLIQVVAEVGTEGDARLIAAAPDLLAELAAVLAEFEAFDITRDSPRAKSLRAAIAKATGGR